MSPYRYLVQLYMVDSTTTGTIVRGLYCKHGLSKNGPLSLLTLPNYYGIVIIMNNIINNVQADVLMSKKLLMFTVKTRYRYRGGEKYLFTIATSFIRFSVFVKQSEYCHCSHTNG